MTAARVTAARVMPADYACSGGHCVTCADEGVPMTVLDADADRGLARCAAEDGAVRIVEIGLIAGVAPGAAVLVHADVAIAALEGAR